MLDFNALKQQYHVNPQRTTLLVLFLVFIMVVAIFFGYRALSPVELESDYKSGSTRSGRIFLPDTLSTRISAFHDSTAGKISDSSVDFQSEEISSGEQFSASKSRGALLLVMMLMILLLGLIYATIGYLRRSKIQLLWNSGNARADLNDVPVQLLHSNVIAPQEQIKIVRVLNSVHVIIHTAGTTPILLQTLSYEEWKKNSEKSS